MIKKNMLQYLLIIVVLLIWGRVILKLFKNFKINDPAPVSQLQLNDNFDDYNLTDTFHISANYPDPFLSEGLRVTKAPEISKTPVHPLNTKPKPIVENKPIVWPIISYKGIIRSLKTSKELVLIYINERGYKMSPGSKQGELILEKVYKDSILVKWNNLKKTIKK